MQKSELIALGVQVLIFLNLLVLVHEGGRFLAAKWRGLKITKLRLFLGGPIWKTRLGQIEFELGWFPLGAYLFLPQMVLVPGEPNGDPKEAILPAITPRDKMIVALAGPIFSLALIVATAILFQFVFVLLEALAALNLLILVHEIGHFLAGKWRGLKIDRFAIWFGTPVCKFRVKDVDYCLGWIPAGGYVSLPQMASMEAVEGKTEATEQLPPVAPLDKIIVAFAGPLFSFLLAVLFAVIVWQVGKPNNAAGDKPILGWVSPQGPAWNAGLRSGDEIREIDGHAINHFAPPEQDSLMWRVITSSGTNIAITYKRNSTNATVFVTPKIDKTRWFERKGLRKIHVGPAGKSLVGAVMTNSPAEHAGLKPGDEILELNGEQIYSPSAVEYASLLMTNENAKPATFVIKRGEERFQKDILAVKPRTPTNAPPLFGILWLVETNRTYENPKPWDQIKTSANQIFATIGAVVSKNTDIGPQQLGGAVMIIRVYTNLFQDKDGWRMVLWFSVLLNVNLALLNLLPLPVLDGGHILLSLIEAARRRPVSPRILNYIQSGFAMLLIGFMLWIAFFDAGDWIRSSRREEPIVFAPPTN